jgi:hypothetical protein
MANIGDKEEKREEKNKKRELNNTLTYEAFMARFENSLGTSYICAELHFERCAQGKTPCGCEPLSPIASHKIGKGNPLIRKAESWERHWQPWPLS